MSKKADCWIRHNSKQQPVDDHVEVEIRTRGGDYEVCKASGFTWDATAENQIMAYRLHKPAEQVEACSKPELQINLPDGYGEIYNAQAVEPGPLQWRDRITEIDVDIKFEEDRYNANMACMNQERAELVQKLASEGFALIGRVVDSAVCQPDPGPWMIGDSVECVSSNYSFITVGTVYVITGFDRNMVQFLDDDGTEMEYERANFKFHSRPSA